MQMVSLLSQCFVSDKGFHERDSADIETADNRKYIREWEVEIETGLEHIFTGASGYRVDYNGNKVQETTFPIMVKPRRTAVKLTYVSSADIQRELDCWQIGNRTNRTYLQNMTDYTPDMIEKFTYEVTNEDGTKETVVRRPNRVPGDMWRPEGGWGKDDIVRVQGNAPRIYRYGDVFSGKRPYDIEENRIFLDGMRWLRIKIESKDNVELEGEAQDKKYQFVFDGNILYDDNIELLANDDQSTTVIFSGHTYPYYSYQEQPPSQVIIRVSEPIDYRIKLQNNLFIPNLKSAEERHQGELDAIKARYDANQGPADFNVANSSRYTDAVAYKAHQAKVDSGPPIPTNPYTITR